MITQSHRFQLPTIGRECDYTMTANREGVICRAILSAASVEENYTRTTQAVRKLSWDEATEDGLFRTQCELLAEIEFAK